jgi:hypothetical protein
VERNGVELVEELGLRMMLYGEVEAEHHVNGVDRTQLELDGSGWAVICPKSLLVVIGEFRQAWETLGLL